MHREHTRLPFSSTHDFSSSSVYILRLQLHGRQVYSKSSLRPISVVSQLFVAALLSQPFKHFLPMPEGLSWSQHCRRGKLEITNIACSLQRKQPPHLLWVA